MTHSIFVFGTLKEGFCNFHVNRGRRVGGAFVTLEPHSLYILGPRHLPWLVQQPGLGHRVVGQLFEVDDHTLAEMDRLERVTSSQSDRSRRWTPHTGSKSTPTTTHWATTACVAC